MNKDKVEQLLIILEDMTLAEWNQVKNEIDIAYRDVEYRKVPNSQLETLKENLIHELKL